MINTLTLERWSGRIVTRDLQNRRLGSLFVPVRRAYVFIMPSILFAAALFCWATSTDFSFVFGACTLSAVAFYLVFDMLARRGPLRFSTVLCFTLGLGYGFGSANTWFTLPRGTDELGTFLHIATSDLTHTMATVLVSLALLLGGGELYEKPIFGEEFRLEFGYRTMVVLTLGLGIVGLAFVTGKLGFQGAQVEGGGHISVLASFGGWMAPPTAALWICAAFNITDRFLRRYAQLVAIGLVLVTVPMGRRNLIYTILLAVFCLRFGHYRFRWSLLKQIVVFSILGGFVYLASIGFYYLREVKFHTKSAVKMSLVQQVEAAYALSQTFGYDKIQEAVSANQQRRTFIIGWLTELQVDAQEYGPAYGQDLVGNIQISIPSILYPEKNVWYSEESLADYLFGASWQDEANSILTGGVVDFGFLGMILYPSILILILRAFFDFVTLRVSGLVGAFLVIAFMATLLQPELNMATYFGAMRDTAMWAFLLTVLIGLPKLHLRRGN